MYTPITPRRSSLAGEAASREQRRNADLDREERNKKFPTIFVKGFAFRPYYGGHDTIQIKGPLCPNQLTNRKCFSPLNAVDGQITQAHCDVCDKDYTMPHSFQDFRTVAHKAYEGLLNSEAEIITLDVPYEAVKAKEQDATRWVKVVWSQKDGRNQAIIYFINKGEGGAKAQIFADMEHEEIRYDANDIPPGSLLAKIKAEFKSTKVEIDYEKKRKTKDNIPLDVTITQAV